MLKKQNKQKQKKIKRVWLRDVLTALRSSSLHPPPSYALNPAAYFANILKESMTGLGTKDERLIYTLVLQAEIRLQDVKRQYMTLFGETLAADVAGDTSGDYKKTLLAIINGNV